MTAPTKGNLVTFAAVLDEFAASQRELALGQAKRQRILLTRPIGDMQVQFETLVDEGASSEEIFTALQPLDRALDRFQAMSDLSATFKLIGKHCASIEQSIANLASERAKYQQANQQHRPAAIAVAQERRKILQHAGTVSHDDAVAKAELEFDRSEERGRRGGEGDRQDGRARTESQARASFRPWP